MNTDDTGDPPDLPPSHLERILEINTNSPSFIRGQEPGQKVIGWTQITANDIRLLLSLPKKSSITGDSEILQQNIDFFQAFINEMVTVVMLARGFNLSLNQLLTEAEYESFTSFIRMRFSNLFKLQVAEATSNELSFITHPNADLVIALVIQKYFDKVYIFLKKDVRFSNQIQRKTIDGTLQQQMDKLLPIMFHFKVKRNIPFNYFTLFQRQNTFRCALYSIKLEDSLQMLTKDIQKMVFETILNEPSVSSTILEEIDDWSFDRGFVKTSGKKVKTLKAQEKSMILRNTARPLFLVDPGDVPSTEADVTQNDDFDPIDFASFDPDEGMDERLNVDTHSNATESDTEDEDETENLVPIEEYNLLVRENEELVGHDLFNDDEVEENVFGLEDLEYSSSEDGSECSEVGESLENEAAGAQIHQQLADAEDTADTIEIPSDVDVGGIFVIKLLRKLKETMKNPTQPFALGIIEGFANGNISKSYANYLLKGCRSLSHSILGSNFIQSITSLRSSHTDWIVRDEDYEIDNAVESSTLNENLATYDMNTAGRVQRAAFKVVGLREKMFKEESVANRFCETFQYNLITGLIKNQMVKKVFICPKRRSTSYSYERYFHRDEPVGLVNFEWHCDFCRANHATKTCDYFLYFSPRAFLSSLFINPQISKLVKESHNKVHADYNQLGSQVTEEHSYVQFQNSEFVKNLKGKTLKSQLSNGTVLTNENRCYYDEVTINLFISLDGITLDKVGNETWPLLLNVMNLERYQQSVKNIFRSCCLPLGNKLHEDAIDYFMSILYDDLALLETNGLTVVDADNGFKTLKIHVVPVAITGDMPATAKLTKSSGHRGLNGCRICMLYKRTYKKTRRLDSDKCYKSLVDLNAAQVQIEFRQLFDVDSAFVFDSCKGTVDLSEGYFTDSYYDLIKKTRLVRDSIITNLNITKNTTLSTIAGGKYSTHLHNFSFALNEGYMIVPDMMHHMLENLVKRFLDVIFSKETKFQKANLALKPQYKDAVARAFQSNLVSVAAIFSRKMDDTILGSSYLKADQINMVIFVEGSAAWTQ